MKNHPLISPWSDPVAVLVAFLIITIGLSLLFSEEKINLRSKRSDPRVTIANKLDSLPARLDSAARPAIGSLNSLRTTLDTTADLLHKMNEATARLIESNRELHEAQARNAELRRLLQENQ